MPFTQNTSPTFPFQPRAGRTTITVAETTTAQTVYAAGPNGSKIVGLFASTTDTSAPNIQVSITNGATQYNAWVVPLAIGQGTGSATPASQNMLDPIYAAGLPVDNDGNPFLYLVESDTLTVNALATLAAGIVTVHCVAADF